MRSATQQAALVLRQAQLQRRVRALRWVAQGEAGALLHRGKSVTKLHAEPLQGVAPQVVLPLRSGHQLQTLLHRLSRVVQLPKTEAPGPQRISE